MSALRRAVTAGAILLALAGASPAGAARLAIPIPSPLEGPLPRYAGAPVAPRPLAWSDREANRALAFDGQSGSGLAPGNGAAVPLPGPLGRGTTRTSVLQVGTCASLAFDAGGRLLGLCNTALTPSLALFDPTSLAPITSLMLPPRMTGDRNDRAGGTHFIVRSDGSLLVPTTTGLLVKIKVGPSTLRQAGAIDLTGVLAPGERLFAVGAGYDGLDWAVGEKGSVVAVPRGGGPPRSLALREPVAEDIATDVTGTYVVTREALYRLKAGGPGGRPRIVWRHAIARGAADPHAGRYHLGSGTPPAMVAGGFVAVADGLNPPRVNVLRIAGPDSGRLKCAVPVFRAGAGSIEAHLVVAGSSIVATNAYGYDGLLTTEGGGTTTGGIARVDVGSRGCKVAWTSDQISPSAQPVLSRSTGLLYTLIKPAGFPDRWNLAGIDWRTGRREFAVLAGEGLGHNSEGGAVVLGPDGAAYAGTFGGIVRFRDRP